MTTLLAGMISRRREAASAYAIQIVSFRSSLNRQGKSLKSLATWHQGVATFGGLRSNGHMAVTLIALCGVEDRVNVLLGMGVGPRVMARCRRGESQTFI